MFKFLSKKNKVNLMKREGGPPKPPPSWVQTPRKTQLNHTMKKNTISNPERYFRLEQPIIYSANTEVHNEGIKVHKQYKNNLQRSQFFNGLENLRGETTQNIATARIIRGKLSQLGILKNINNLTNLEKIKLGLKKPNVEPVIPHNIKTYIETHNIIPSFRAVLGNPQKYQDKINTKLLEKFKRDVKQPQLYYNKERQKKSQLEHTAKINQAIQKLKNQNQYNPIDAYNDTLILIKNEMKHIEQQKAQNQAYLPKNSRGSTYSDESVNSGIGKTPPSSPKYGLHGTKMLINMFNDYNTQAGGNYSKLKLNKTLKKKLLKKTLKNKYINK